MKSFKHHYYYKRARRIEGITIAIPSNYGIVVSFVVIIVMLLMTKDGKRFIIKV